MDKIEIALASDDKYFPGLLASISSIVIGASEDYKYNFYVIDGGISENNKAFLENCLSRFKKKCSIIFLVPDLDIFKDLPKMFFGSVLPYARLLLPEMLSIDKIIYVDSDILFFNDISELWELDLQGNHAAAAKDMLINKFKYEYKDCSVFNLDPEETFFNSGIMVLDLNAFRKRSLHKETIRLRGEYPNYFKYHDQSPLNVVFKHINIITMKTLSF
jgi:lipopolysaccharide biosynthesis glycosyltransferase